MFVYNLKKKNASLKSDVEKSDIEELNTIPHGFVNQQSKVNNRDIYELKTVKVFVNKDVLKACVCYFYQIFIFSPNDIPLKTMKNVFYFI